MAAVPPLASYTTSGAQVLYNTEGQQTATLPGGGRDIDVASPLGNRLLLIHRLRDGNTVDHLDAISQDGGLQQLVTFPSNIGFVDAIGAPDGHAWAWMVRGSRQQGCLGYVPPVTTHVYIASSPGPGSLVAQLPVLSGGASWGFYQWTAAGIVLVEGGQVGCNGDAIQGYDMNPKDLLDPTTGKVSSLARTTGPDCHFREMADNGTIVCQLGAVFSSGVGPVILRVISPGGARSNVPTDEFLPGCTAKDAAFSDVTISSDGQFVTLLRTCHPPEAALPTLTLWVIAAETLKPVTVNGSVDTVGGWLEGQHTFIADVNGAGALVSAAGVVSILATRPVLITGMGHV